MRVRAGSGHERRWLLDARRWLQAGAVLSGLLLGGCQTDVYSNITETDANEMLAILMASGVSTEKVAKGKEGFSITVDSTDMLRAIALLRDSGYPKNTRESLGKAFQKSGIMSSPFEERVRYIFALGEDVAQTLSRIDGVVDARVHIVLPDAPQLGQAVKPSSAAVFIKHRAGVDLDFFVPQIRRLVSNSIEGLEYAAVTVVLADAAPTKSVATGDGTVEMIPGVAIRSVDKPRFWLYAIGLAALVLALVGANIATWIFLTRKKRPTGTAVATGSALVEPS